MLTPMAIGGAARRPEGVLALAALLLACLLFLWRSELAAPTPAAGGAFDVQAAQRTLRDLLGDGAPHPVGSPANARVRDKIVTALRAAGYAPRMDAALACAAETRWPGCAWVENVIAEKPGAGGDAILVSAHYDSVAAGPGAGDDAAGVAVVLELARRLATAPAARNGFIFLLSDGEEAGLRGAQRFAAADPAFARVKLVLNVEARGASGPSVMFETGPRNAARIALLARALPRPVANSLTYEIYKRMPNDTDFSVYRARGAYGFNFAATGAASLYHSARDTAARFDLRTLAHHGENVFALAAALRGADLAALASARGEASYFDLFGRTLIVWPSPLDAPLALAGLLGVLVLIGARRRVFNMRVATWSVGAVIANVGAVFLLGWTLAFPLGAWPGAHPMDHPHPWPGRAALACAALLAACAGGSCARKAGFTAAALTAWLVLAALGVAVAFMAPGAAYALTWPTALFAAAGAGEALLRRSAPELRVAATLGFAVAAFFWSAHFLAAEVVLGFAQSQWRALILAPVAVALAPLLALRPEARMGPAAASMAAAMLAASVWGWRTPAYTPDRPRGVNVVYHQDGDERAWLRVATMGPDDEAFLKAAGFPQHAIAIGLHDGPAWGRFKPTPSLRLPPPQLIVRTVTRTGELATAHGVLCAGRAGFTLDIIAGEGSGVRAVRVVGQPALLTQNGAGYAPLSGLGARSAEIEIDFDARAPARLFLLERSPPPDDPAFRAVQALRPVDAAPAFLGDHASVSEEIVLRAP
ncbi:MAG: M28 family peptidase [Hyphomonadaceae bacterium]